MIRAKIGVTILIMRTNFIAAVLIFAAAVSTSIRAQTPPVDASAFIRTPPAPHTPRINGPHVYGERPGRPFFYHLPVTGDRPMTFKAENLPTGLTLDPMMGNITGSVATAGTYDVKFTAKNAQGVTTQTITFAIGPLICLTPPLGWNSWNCFNVGIDETKIRAAAEAMVKTGLIDHGWTYINMDDRWEGQRDAQGRIQSSAGFPDMKGMVDYIHGLGLKVGLYSSPGPFTCAGAPGSYQHEDQDAQVWADWGIDYMKYDWCSYQENEILRRAEGFEKALPADAAAIKALAQQQYDNTVAWRLAGDLHGDAQHQARQKLEAANNVLNDQIEKLYDHCPYPLHAEINTETDKAPYRIMRASLDKVNRDILYSFCQYGMGDVQTWGAEIGGNTWRVTGDIGPNWPSIQEHGFELNPDLAKWANPGHWNDPDMLEIGNGDLTPDENYTHMTQWCMLAAPLLIGCDMTKMSPFIVSLFSNDEVLAVNQDSLGKQGTLLKRDKTAKTEVWIKPLEDESIAVALYNRSDAPADVSVAAAELPLYGPASAFVRDLWRQKDLGVIGARLTAHVAPHGAELYRIEPVKAATTAGTKP
jgi:alpha-galactosidase